MMNDVIKCRLKFKFKFQNFQGWLLPFKTMQNGCQKISYQSRYNNIINHHQSSKIQNGPKSQPTYVCRPKNQIKQRHTGYNNTQHIFPETANLSSNRMNDSPLNSNSSRCNAMPIPNLATVPINRYRQPHRPQSHYQGSHIHSTLFLMPPFRDNGRSFRWHVESKETPVERSRPIADIPMKARLLR